MRRVLLLTSLLVVFRCAAPAPEPVPAPPPPLVVAAAPVEEKVIGIVRVTASALNVRKEASTEADVVMQVKKGQALSLLAEGDSWMKVKLASGETGWVAARFVARDGAKVATKKKSKGKTSCPADSDFAFVDTPTLAFSDSGAHGIVIVEANVTTRGNVTSTKVVSNSTGDEALAFLAQREIRSATFAPPIRNCVPRAFIFTYRRTF
ncbi:MAG TPA: SH3 domain-containing protein [Thermoanaerobaculia bacterium]|nr:SH3 domain-containing protein [Thermoanaerobaculia bacterium]